LSNFGVLFLNDYIFIMYVDYILIKRFLHAFLQIILQPEVRDDVRGGPGGTGGGENRARAGPDGYQ
jgi:hypothetical protein